MQTQIASILSEDDIPKNILYFHILFHTSWLIPEYHRFDDFFSLKPWNAFGYYSIYYWWKLTNRFIKFVRVKCTVTELYYQRNPTVVCKKNYLNNTYQNILIAEILSDLVYLQQTKIVIMATMQNRTSTIGVKIGNRKPTLVSPQQNITSYLTHEFNKMTFNFQPEVIINTIFPTLPSHNCYHSKYAPLFRYSCHFIISVTVNV